MGLFDWLSPANGNSAAKIFDPGYAITGGLFGKEAAHNYSKITDPIDLWGSQGEYYADQQREADEAYQASQVSPEQIAREKFARFQEFGRPIEDNYMAGLFDQDAREGQVSEARGLVRGQFDNARRAMSQTNERYGQPTGDMADFQARRVQIEQALAETENANVTRGLVRDRDIAGAHSMSAMGRGLSGQVGQAGLAADSLSTARQQQTEAAAAQSAQSSRQMQGSVAGTVIGAFI